MHDFIVSIAMNFSIIFAAIACIIRFKYITKEYYPFLAIIWLGLLNESLSLVAVFSIGSNAMNSNIFVLLESWLIFLQFNKWNNSKSNRYYWLAGIGLLVWLIDNYIINSITQNNSLFRVFYAFAIVFLSINQVNKILIYGKGILVKNPTFIICMAFLFYYACKAFVEAFNALHLGFSDKFLWNLWIVLYFINFISNILYAVAILCIPKKQEFTLPY